MTTSKAGKAIEKGCSLAWGGLGAACGVVYGLAYARRGNWKKAAGAAAGIVGGFAAQKLVYKGLMKGAPKVTKFHRTRKQFQRELRRYTKSMKSLSGIHGMAATNMSNSLVVRSLKGHSKRRR